MSFFLVGILCANVSAVSDAARVGQYWTISFCIHVVMIFVSKA